MGFSTPTVTGLQHEAQQFYGAIGDAKARTLSEKDSKPKEQSPTQEQDAPRRGRGARCKHGVELDVIL